MVAHAINDGDVLEPEGDALARGRSEAQAIMREVNEQIHRLGRRWNGDTKECEIYCECGDSECLKPLRIAYDSYEAVRRSPTRFILLTGHEALGHDHVVEHGDRHVIIEKIGPGAEAAVRLDPRRCGR
jgi:hypothetical protein